MPFCVAECTRIYRILFILQNGVWQCPLMFLLLLVRILLLLLLSFVFIILIFLCTQKPPSDQDSNYDEIGLQHYW